MFSLAAYKIIEIGSKNNEINKKIKLIILKDKPRALNFGVVPSANASKGLPSIVVLAADITIGGRRKIASMANTQIPCLKNLFQL